MNAKTVTTYLSLVFVVLIMGTFAVRTYSRATNDLATGPWRPNSLEVDQRQLATTQQSISDLSAHIQSAEKNIREAKNLLDLIVIENPKFYWTQSGFLDTPVIAFKITNGGKIALKRVYFHGVLRTPGRAIPWVEDDFNYEFNGGLEPGENKQLELEPNMFGPWAADETKGRHDLAMTVTVINFEGSDGKEIVDTNAMDIDSKRKELDELKTTAAELSRKIQAESRWW